MLAAGKFSVFEASANRRAAALFSKLCRHDPTVETFAMGFPWTGVRAAAQPPPEMVIEKTEPARTKEHPSRGGAKR